MNDISENVTLVQLMDTVGNVNNAVSIVGNRIFDSNYKKAPQLTTETLNIICSTVEGEGIFTMFETMFSIFRYVND